LKGLLKYIQFVMRSKGVAGVIPRARMLLDRFDLSGKKMGNAVAGINALGAKYRFKPAMIVPAVVLQRHKRLLQYASGEDLEFAIHGYTHKNHRPWSLEKQKEEVEKAKDVFDEMGMPYCGFRAPYLSCNSDTDVALNACGIAWNSDQGIMWNYSEQSSRDSYSTGEAIDILYDPDDASQTLAIPRMHENMVCIPLVLPDDEILVDRMGIQDSNTITGIWCDILEQTHARGDVFVLQYHPERYVFCNSSMEALLAHMAQSDGRFWVTDMRLIAEWWKARDAFSFAISKSPGGAFEVQCTCDDRATILVRNVPGTSAPFHRGYDYIEERQFSLNTDGVKPCIGLHPQCTADLQTFIKELGFAYELTETDSDYSVFFDDATIYSVATEVDILDRIEQSGQPLVRYWPWPDGYQSAFATSHDLDCMTLGDFVYRALGW
jgi:hypothetical protein